MSKEREMEVFNFIKTKLSKGISPGDYGGVRIQIDFHSSQIYKYAGE